MASSSRPPAEQTAPGPSTAVPPTDVLGTLERKIMDLLWNAGPATARELAQALPEPTPATTTVLTVLAHLHRKGLVTRHRTGRAHRYHARTSREDHLAGVMRHTLTRAPDSTAVLARFLATIPPDEHAALRELLR